MKVGEFTMPKRTDNTAKITDVTMKVVKLLTPLDSDGRQKAIKASLTLLGEAAVDIGTGGSGSNGDSGASVKDSAVLPSLSTKVTMWIKQNGLTKSQLEHVFDIDGTNVNVLRGSVPGKSSKVQTISAYILKGVEQFLATGEPMFDDKSARKLCEDLGCYNSANHAVYMNSIGNSITGSKDKGWKLTAPGLKKGADLIKEMTKGA
jgi:hypothetical protein